MRVCDGQCILSVFDCQSKVCWPAWRTVTVVIAASQHFVHISLHTNGAALLAPTLWWTFLHERVNSFNSITGTVVSCEMASGMARNSISSAVDSALNFTGRLSVSIAAPRRLSCRTRPVVDHAGMVVMAKVSGKKQNGCSRLWLGRQRLVGGSHVGNFCYLEGARASLAPGRLRGVTGMSNSILLGAVVFLLLAAAVLMLVMVVQLRAMRREVESTRLQLAKMDWGAMLLNGVQQLKQATVALEQIDKRLQKLEALEKVQISHINMRQGT